VASGAESDDGGQDSSSHGVDTRTRRECTTTSV
jgi:hypothetical protein